MKTLTKAFKIFFRFVVPAVLVLLYFLKTLVLPEKRHLEIMYTISLSACMGYFTNFIAIKMLFRPKKETFFKRQGVIPKNKGFILDDYTAKKWIADFPENNEWDMLSLKLMEIKGDQLVDGCYTE